MREYSAQQIRMANFLTAILFPLGTAITACFMSSDFKARAGALLAAGLIALMCLYIWQQNQIEESQPISWLIFILFGGAWTVIGDAIGAHIHHVSYFGLLTFQSAAWDGLSHTDLFAVGPCMTIIGLVTLLRNVILWLLNTLGIIILRLLSALKIGIKEE